MARRARFSGKNKQHSSRSGINPGSILRPRKGQSPPPPPKTTSRYSRPVQEESFSSMSRPVQEESFSSMPMPGAEESVSSTINPNENILFSPPPIDLNPAAVNQESSLPYLRNPYPDELGTDPSFNYRRDGGNIRLEGKYEENFLEFSDVDLNGITTCENTSFNFLVQFQDGSLHTSPSFLASLNAEYNSSNPYKNKNTVSVVKLDAGFITKYGSKDMFSVPEQYAEVDISNTINTTKDILYHIDWLVGADSDELREASTIGDWSVGTTDELGFDHFEALEILNGAEPSKSGGNLGSTVTTTDDPIVTTDDSVKDPIPVDDAFPPFGFRGRTPGERKNWTKDGQDYIWKRGRKRFGRRGRDNGEWVLLSDDITRTKNRKKLSDRFRDAGKPINTNSSTRTRPRGGGGGGGYRPRKRFL
jgi:hypothetical protein